MGVTGVPVALSQSTHISIGLQNVTSEGLEAPERPAPMLDASGASEADGAGAVPSAMLGADGAGGADDAGAVWSRSLHFA